MRPNFCIFSKISFYLYFKSPLGELKRKNFNKKNKYDTSLITGIYLKLGGRLNNQKIIPRRTVQQIQRGSLSNDKVDFIEKSLSTGKTKRGAYSFSVQLSHILR